jgi:hypothetical protein
MASAFDDQLALSIVAFSRQLASHFATTVVDRDTPAGLGY